MPEHAYLTDLGLDGVHQSKARLFWENANIEACFRVFAFRSVYSLLQRSYVLQTPAIIFYRCPCIAKEQLIHLQFIATVGTVRNRRREGDKTCGTPHRSVARGLLIVGKAFYGTCQILLEKAFESFGMAQVTVTLNAEQNLSLFEFQRRFRSSPSPSRAYTR
jgi:hypothetical protein